MWKPGWNYGADGELWVDSRWADSIAKCLLEFDLGGVPKGARVASANLDLYQLNSSLNGGPVGVHRVTNTWEEGTQSGGSGTGGNWTERDVGTAWAVAGGDHDAAPIMTTIVPAATGWVSWDIAELMNGWVAGTHQNFGLVLTPETPGTAAHFHSSDSSNAALRPKLTITYACECGMTCLTPQGFGNVLMVVQDKTNPDTHESSQQSLLESWGYSVNLISDDDPQADFDSAFGNNDVVYMTGSAIVTQVGTKLSNAPIGVVNNNGQLNDELGISSTRARPIGTGIDVTDNSHYITVLFATGGLPVYTAAMKGLPPPAPLRRACRPWRSGAALRLSRSWTRAPPRSVAAHPRPVAWRFPSAAPRGPTRIGAMSTTTATSSCNGLLSGVRATTLSRQDSTSCWSSPTRRVSTARKLQRKHSSNPGVIP